MSGGTGEFESSSEDEVLVPITVTRLASGYSTDPTHPALYPCQTIRISTATTSIVVTVAGFNTQLEDRDLINFAREILNTVSR